MLYLLFRLGEDRYALRTRQVVEVLPRVQVKAIPGAPAGVVGVFNYHGNAVPLIDLSAGLLERPAKPHMSTRIILVNYREMRSDDERKADSSQPVDAAETEGESHLLGLLAEEVTSTIKRRPEDFEDSGVSADGAPFLGPVTTGETGIIQRVEVDLLLTKEVRDALFRATQEVD